MHSINLKNLHTFCGKIKYLSILSLFFLLLSGGNSFAQRNNKGQKPEPDSVLTARRHMIHRRSAMVMPFNMSKVTHYFIKTEEGGILRIIVKSAADSDQVRLIRKHLLKEQNLFSAGNFRDPKTLHGMNMPGLNILTKSKDKFKVEYKELKSGAQLAFTSNDKTVVNALHVWFAAQLRDHGHDAKSIEK